MKDSRCKMAPGVFVSGGYALSADTGLAQADACASGALRNQITILGDKQKSYLAQASRLCQLNLRTRNGD